tara:strand:+ start:765 stop:1064 length:300 start_codon:yes stop_codon:yes gene_type:complete
MSEDTINVLRDILIRNAQNPREAKEEISTTMGDIDTEEFELVISIVDDLIDIKSTKKKVKKQTKKVQSLEIKKGEKPQPIKDEEEVIDLDEIDLDNLVL